MYDLLKPSTAFIWRALNLILFSVAILFSCALCCSVHASAEDVSSDEGTRQNLQAEEKVIYLTFDDGPSENTPKLLKILDHYGVKATFFVVDTGYDGYITQIAEAGHTVAMHSASHKFHQIYKSEEAFFEDLHLIQSCIYECTGQFCTMLRFPGGSSNTVSRRYCRGIMTRLVQRIDEMGYHYFDWNVDSMDTAGAKSSEEVYRNVIAQIKGKDVAVVLQHDIYGFSVDAVPAIIQWGVRAGYTFKALDLNSPPCKQPVVN